MPRALTEQFDEEEVDIIEYDGDRILVENEYGKRRWVTANEIIEDDE